MYILYVHTHVHMYCQTTPVYVQAYVKSGFSPNGGTLEFPPPFVYASLGLLVAEEDA